MAAILSRWRFRTQIRTRDVTHNELYMNWSGVFTHWGRDKIATISQTTVSNVFSWMKMYEFRLKFHWSLFLGGPINNIPALVQIMAWRRPDGKPLSEPMMVQWAHNVTITSLLRHNDVATSSWLNNNVIITSRGLCPLGTSSITLWYIHAIMHRETFPPRCNLVVV